MIANGRELSSPGQDPSVHNVAWEERPGMALAAPAAATDAGILV